MTKTAFSVSTVLFVVLIACIIGTGCTSGQGAQTTVQSTSPAPAAIPSQNLSSPTGPATTVAALSPATSPAVSATTVPAVSATTAGAVPAIEVTLNSAVKQTSVGTYSARNGNVFLVLDVTIKNNDQNNVFGYSDASFALYDKTVQPPHKLSPITSNVAGSLTSPFTTGMVPFKSEKTGQIVFPVKENSVSYKFTVVDPTGIAIASVDNINVS
jgi:Domain of unknown function (DUF4352)